jgi:hypothetical protein
MKDSEKLKIAVDALKFYKAHMQLGSGIYDSGQVATEALEKIDPANKHKAKIDAEVKAGK